MGKLIIDTLMALVFTGLTAFAASGVYDFITKEAVNLRFTGGFRPLISFPKPLRERFS